MASYSQPSDKYSGIYNPDYFIGKDDEAKISAVGNAVQVTGDYVKRDGSNVMTGTLTTPEIILFNDGSIYFDDTTHQHTAFTDSLKSDVIANTQKLTSLSYLSNDDSTSITGALKIKKIVFLDDSNSEQSVALSPAMITDINSSKQKTTGTTYDAGNLKTTISICMQLL
jgi:uncharacterized protein (UPF0333 family)